MTDKYKAAYERQKIARKRAEKLLEDRSRDLYESSEQLRHAYEKVKQQKNTIYHQEKLASVGLLGAGVAHEINNPAGFVKSNLNSLSGYIDEILQYNQTMEALLVKSNPDHATDDIQRIKKEYDLEFVLSDIRSLISESTEGIARIERIVKSLKDFSRPDAEEKENFDLNTCVSTTLVLVESKTKYKAEIQTKFSDIPEICGMPGSINQVILNMILNAVHAIKDFGEILIETSAENNFAILTIADSGSGIEEENLKHIFDPFFTTKDLDEGTGLGLSVSHGIVKKHGGDIKVQSELGKGTTFRIYLPCGECS